MELDQRNLCHFHTIWDPRGQSLDNHLGQDSNPLSQDHLSRVDVFPGCNQTILNALNISIVPFVRIMLPNNLLMYSKEEKFPNDRQFMI